MYIKEAQVSFLVNYRPLAFGMSERMNDSTEVVTVFYLRRALRSNMAERDPDSQLNLELKNEIKVHLCQCIKKNAKMFRTIATLVNLLLTVQYRKIPWNLVTRNGANLHKSVRRINSGNRWMSLVLSKVLVHCVNQNHSYIRVAKVIVPWTAFQSKHYRYTISQNKTVNLLVSACSSNRQSCCSGIELLFNQYLQT